MRYAFCALLIIFAVPSKKAAHQPEFINNGDANDKMEAGITDTRIINNRTFNGNSHPNNGR